MVVRINIGYASTNSVFLFLPQHLAYGLQVSVFEMTAYKPVEGYWELAGQTYAFTVKIADYGCL